uniref:CRAL-TRIO domain-containing protein n=1 Tax=Chlamydomonas leiostraca TaxID=1034604 RepID=A0A7S0RJ18_9CHLO|mmetsp:Transcript_23403/g.59907  ORF Transcript_23403/g.59907 Transcript_23403/m.59907 type:complete len:277 (+) Transcript_23403:67-897(+)|eukprot:CAMPEP_0202866196 /NCGR_PEP_ID=MMETSP1391-20130828/7252_1 /ASSEMBLY_ACC=CAM_ASM_000867 /TAXON_ID=1034604 /ORGANISM="Chlamydomonas leiostraca, Strain SAG 11-49" /LENGTH=276 /DNA_ID=CAMNT_0049546121 /DNA_START=67 /DNA_END=897 /DNA_ORIENTATION=+
MAEATGLGSINNDHLVASTSGNGSVALSPHSQRGFFSRAWWRASWWWSSAARVDAEAEQEFEAALAAGAGEDFSDLDTLGFLKYGPELHDRSTRPLVIVCAAAFPAAVVPRERLYRYIVKAMHGVLRAAGETGQYSMVWAHTNAKWGSNCPGAAWLWHVYERLLPSRVRTGVHTLHVLHCDGTLWGATLALMPWLTGKVWAKVNWVPRVEFLWEYMDKAAVLPLLPEYVTEHDAFLEGQPLADYGLVAPPAEVAGLAAMAGTGPAPMGALNMAPPL